jgi:hypothetical protein
MHLEIIEMNLKCRLLSIVCILNSLHFILLTWRWIRLAKKKEGWYNIFRIFIRGVKK